jgi:hypothetical protein
MAVRHYHQQQRRIIIGDAPVRYTSAVGVRLIGVHLGAFQISQFWVSGYTHLTNATAESTCGRNSLSNLAAPSCSEGIGRDYRDGAFMAGPGFN